MMTEYDAPNRSKNSPAYAHSFNLGTPGTRIVMEPMIFATPIKAIRYSGYPKVSKSVTESGVTIAFIIPEKSMEAANNPVNVQ